jgi:hypothetical protein
MAVPPIVKAFLVCDHVIHEKETNKKSLIGIFHHIHAERFPCRHGSLSIYANITEAQGEYTFQLRLVSLKDEKQIGTGTTPPLKIPDRLQTAELDLKLRNIVFPEPGKYEFRLVANDEQIAQKIVSVEGARPPEEGD